MSRFKEFSDEEIYILSRQAIESSYEILMSETYNESEQDLHRKLLNELISERKLRKL